MDGMFLGPALVTGRVAGMTIAAVHNASGEPLDIAARAADQPLPDADTWRATLTAENLRALLATERDGYWHFQISHELVLERGYDCTMCHSAQVPFAALDNREHKIAQTNVCGNCHGR